MILINLWEILNELHDFNQFTKQDFLTSKQSI